MKEVPVITSDRVLLRAVRLEDVPLIVQWKSDPLVRSMALGPLTVVDPEGQRHDVERALSSDDETYCIVCLREQERPIGYIRTNFMDDEKKIVWLRFALGSHRGQGYMKESLRSCLGHQFDSGIDRIEAEVYDSNHPSMHLMESIGFVAEGRKRDAHHDGKKYVDVIVYGLLRKEWKGGAGHSSMIKHGT
jgi:[ribosomal protein S5]-alanine N-acetyltransferase